MYGLHARVVQEFSFRSSEARVVRSFMQSVSEAPKLESSGASSVKRGSSSRQELPGVFEAPRLESSGASERQ